MNYESIKALAAESGMRVTDMLALAPQNDPFYTGRPAEVEAAQWFLTLYRKFGYQGGVHLRRIHYRIVSQDPPVIMPGGGTYENTENCWDFLGNAAKWARYLDLVPADQFVDRRNPGAIIHSRFLEPGDWVYQDPTPSVGVTECTEWDSYNVPSLPDLPALPDGLPAYPDFIVNGYDGVQQGYLVEVWAEKTTMNDILIPLCGEYGVNLVTGAGELSITAVIEFIKRARVANRPARILYISDFDPAGLGMPISVARKIEFYLRKSAEEFDIKLDPIVLNQEQIEFYNLPRVPVKDSDKRKGNFEAAYGQGQVELDALEALHPGELRNIVQEAIFYYYDESLTDRAWDARNRLRWCLTDEQEAVLVTLGVQVSDLEVEYREILADYSETRSDFASMINAFQPQLDAYRQRLNNLQCHARELHRAVYEKMLKRYQAIDLNASPFILPEPELPEEPDCLYESQRDYFEQLRHYKAQRNNAVFCLLGTLIP
jgi:hypothetical protein